MYQDEKLVCEDCGAEFVFTAGEQEFYAEKGLSTSRKDALIAVKPADSTTEDQEKCMMRFVQNAERKLRFLLSRFPVKKSIAKIVFQL